MELYTIQIAKWRIAQAAGIPVYDTTVKSGGNNLFTPNWPMVERYKLGLISEEEYTQLYHHRLKGSYRDRQADWLAWLRQPICAVACYCSPDKFCHRHLLVPLLDKCAQHHQIPFLYLGEIKHENDIRETPPGVVGDTGGL